MAKNGDIAIYFVKSKNLTELHLVGVFDLAIVMLKAHYNTIQSSILHQTLSFKRGKKWGNG